MKKKQGTLLLNTMLRHCLRQMQFQSVKLRTCMKTECVISGTTGGLVDPNYCYKISCLLTRLIIKLAGQTYKSAVDDISLYYIVSLSKMEYFFFRSSRASIHNSLAGSECNGRKTSIKNGQQHLMKAEQVSLRTCIKNRMCNQWDNWRAYGPELLL